MRKEILVVTGMSGSGRTTVNQVLTDEGYVILENLSTELLDSMMQAIVSSEEDQKVAIILNVRDYDRFTKRLKIILNYEDQDVEIKRIMLTTNETVLINRYQESRKLHPISRKNPEISLYDAIKIEQSVFDQVNDEFNFILDTSALSGKDTKAIIRKFLKADQFEFAVNISSFGFKYGIPLDSDLVFDVRFLTNPFYIPELRVQSGLDKPVRDYVFSDELANRYFENVKQTIITAIEGYKKEGRLLVNIAIGCTGGQHRSVSYVERLVEELNMDFVVAKHIEGNKGHWHK